MEDGSRTTTDHFVFLLFFFLLNNESSVASVVQENAATLVFVLYCIVTGTTNVETAVTLLVCEGSAGAVVDKLV